MISMRRVPGSKAIRNLGAYLWAGGRTCARLWPEGSGRGRGKRDSARNFRETCVVSTEQLRPARQAVPHPDLVQAVIGGRLSPDVIYNVIDRATEEPRNSEPMTT